MKPKKNVYIGILSLANGLVILFLFSSQIILLYISIAIALLSILIPQFAFLISAVLETVFKAVGNFTNSIILAIVYIAFLTPLAILYRVFNKKKKIDPETASSFFSDKNHTYGPEDFINQW